MLILSQSDLRAVLTMRDVIEAVEQGFRLLASGDAKAPERLRLDVPSHHGVLLEMPAYAGFEGGSALGTKIVTVFERNTQRALEIVQSVYLLLESETGIPLSLMDGRYITAMRTAAASAVATRLMATRGPKQLSIFGAGVQAQFHIEAMIEAAEIERVRIASPTADHARSLADRVRAVHNLHCEVVSAELAAETADLICACTTSATPLFDGRLLKAGTHINAVGAFTPSTRELDTETVRRARVIIDAESSAGRESGEIFIAKSEGAIDARHIKGTLADVVSGKVAGRESAIDITLFKSCGLAIEDLVTARLAYAKALGKGIGTDVML